MGRRKRKHSVYREPEAWEYVDAIHRASVYLSSLAEKIANYRIFTDEFEEISPEKVRKLTESIVESIDAYNDAVTRRKRRRLPRKNAEPHRRERWWSKLKFVLV